MECLSVAVQCIPIFRFFWNYIVHKQLFSENSLPVVTHFVVMFHCCSYNALLSGCISLSDSHVREGGGSVTSNISSSR
jgi:hypothetical protein